MILNWPLLCILLIFYATHSILADLGVKARLHAIVPTRYYRIMYNLVSIAFVITIAWICVESPKTSLIELPVWITAIGWVGFVGGFVLNLLALSQYDGAEFIGTSYLNQTVETKAGLGGKLNRSGINTWVRHPIYSSILLIAWAWFLISPNIEVLQIAVITTVYIPIGIHYEERKLIAEFGDAYRSYQREVKKIIPGIW
ncbi:MAG: isoprenylcysteine carboxylmethyltransferase family protein [Bacteroidota bacterium]